MNDENGIWKERHLLPNKDGYTFRGKLEDGRVVYGVVRRSRGFLRGAGMHFVEPLENQPKFKWWDLTGWQAVD